MYMSFILIYFYFQEGLGVLKDPRILNSLLFSGRKGLITVGKNIIINIQFYFKYNF